MCSLLRVHEGDLTYSVSPWEFKMVHTGDGSALMSSITGLLVKLGCVFCAAERFVPNSVVILLL